MLIVMLQLDVLLDGLKPLNGRDVETCQLVSKAFCHAIEKHECSLPKREWSCSIATDKHPPVDQSISPPVRSGRTTPADLCGKLRLLLFVLWNCEFRPPTSKAGL